MSEADYTRLLEFRTGLRTFLYWSEEQAAMVGLTAAQHQLLLAIRGCGQSAGPTISELAAWLLLKHHSVVGLVDRAETLDLVYRVTDDDDARVVRVVLSPNGRRKVEKLSTLHLEELRRLASRTNSLWANLHTDLA